MEQCPDDPPDLVIAADTVVVKGEEIMEKPKDSVDHARMLAELNDGEVSDVGAFCPRRWRWSAKSSRSEH